MQMRTDGIVDQRVRDTGIFDLGRQVGAIQMANVQAEFLAVARIRLFDEIKESNKYKDLAISGPDGNLAMARNLEEFCRIVFGVGYAKMVDASKDLNALGQDSYESANRLGLNRRQLRLIRSLPDAQRTAVADAIQSESKTEVVAIIEDLAAQLAQAQDDMVEAKLEKDATDKLLATKDAKINKLSRHIAKTTPDQKQLELQKEATELMNDALGCVRGQMRQAFHALTSHYIEHDGQQPTVFMAGLLGQLQADVTALREEFNLPDVSNAADLQLMAEQAQWAGK